jgi:hypothetical protein
MRPPFQRTVPWLFKTRVDYLIVSAADRQGRRAQDDLTDVGSRQCATGPIETPGYRERRIARDAPAI